MTGDIQEAVQYFMDRLRNPTQTRPIRKFWTEPYQIITNDHFKIMQFIPIRTAPVHDFDRAMQAMYDDVLPSISSSCQERHGIKVWPVFYVCYESANPLDEQFKSFDAHLPVSHSNFFYNQPKLISDNSSPYHPGIGRLIVKILDANAKLIRKKSGLMLAKIYSFNLNVCKFTPLAGSAYSPHLTFV